MCVQQGTSTEIGRHDVIPADATVLRVRVSASDSSPSGILELSHVSTSLNTSVNEAYENVVQIDERRNQYYIWRFCMRRVR